MIIGYHAINLLLLVLLCTQYTLGKNLVYESPFPNSHPSLARPRLQTRAPIASYKDGLAFPQSVSSGDPFHDSIVLWTRAVPNGSEPHLEPDPGADPDSGRRPPGNHIVDSDVDIDIRWQVSRHQDVWDSQNLVSSGSTSTSLEVDYTVKVIVENLEPYTTYYYRFRGPAGDISPVGQFKTLPAPDDPVPYGLRLAVFSCANFPNGHFNAYGVAGNHSELLDYVVHLGDYTYEYQDDYYGHGSFIGRIPDPPDRECTSLQDYRRRYAGYKMDPDLRNLHERLAFFLTWDDHEVADNTWANGSAHSNNTKSGYVNGISFDERKANAVRAYYEYMPIRQVDADDQLRIWRTFQLGKLGDLIVLDTRQYDRGITTLYFNNDEVIALKDDENRSLMGHKQEQWFYDELSKSYKRGADWRIIGQQIVFSELSLPSTEWKQPINVDAWDGYTSNRRRVLDHLYNNKIRDNIFLSGDAHANWVFDLVYDRNKSYNAITGEGAIGVEFGGTAVSSPSSYGINKTQAYYQNASDHLTALNSELKWAEGALRGYYELSLTPEAAIADFISVLDVSYRNDLWELAATFRVEHGENRVSRAPGGVKGGRGSFGVGFHGALEDARQIGFHP